MRLLAAPVALLLAAVVSGVPSLVPASAAAPDRIAGADRYETSALVADHFPATTPVVHVVTGVRHPDALAAGAAAAAAGGPVLLAGGEHLSPPVADALVRLDPASVVVVGGTGSVSESVVAEIGSLTDADLRRVAGNDRYETAAAVSAATFDRADTVYVVNGVSFPDAVSGVPAAAAADAPLLLTTATALPASTATEISRLGAAHVVVLGGPSRVSQAVVDDLVRLAGRVTRIDGPDRYATSAAISADSHADGADVVYLATGRFYADALAAGPLAARSGGPLLLAGANCVPGVVLDELDRLAPSRVVLLGGDGALGRGVEDRTRCPSPDARGRDPEVTGAPSPAWDDDGPDPHVVRFDDRWYAYTTGTTWGNRIGVLVSDRPDGGWQTITGQPWGSTALAGVPAWQVPDTQWAPGVYRFAGRYVLFYAAQVRDSMEWCISVAVSPEPGGPFHDLTGDSGPILCQDHLGGVIDPHPFVDADGTPWLHVKNNDGFAGRDADATAVSRVLGTRLGGDGVTPIGSLHTVLVKDSETHPWQTTVDNPQMVLHDGVYHLFHTGGDYVGNDTYATGHATCAGPAGPCTTSPTPLLTSYGDVAGPGGGTVAIDADGRWWMSYHAWPAGCADYTCGERRLYVASLRWR